MRKSNLASRLASLSSYAISAGVNASNTIQQLTERPLREALGAEA